MKSGNYNDNNDDDEEDQDPHGFHGGKQGPVVSRGKIESLLGFYFCGIFRFDGLFGSDDWTYSDPSGGWHPGTVYLLVRESLSMLAKTVQILRRTSSMVSN